LLCRTGDSHPLGPQDYRATHGLFRSGPAGTSLADLAGRDWQQVIGGADQAMVSYPLLLGADAYFSLGTVADFLPRTGLGLRLALDLDGGPVACQGVHVPGNQRRSCGEYELAVHDRHLQLLRPLVDRRWSGLPDVPLVQAR
jgi:hypothetical protein